MSRLLSHALARHVQNERWRCAASRAFAPFIASRLCSGRLSDDSSLANIKMHSALETYDINQEVLMADALDENQTTALLAIDPQSTMAVRYGAAFAASPRPAIVGPIWFQRPMPLARLGSKSSARCIIATVLAAARRGGAARRLREQYGVERSWNAVHRAASFV